MSIRQKKQLLVITIPFSGLLTQNFDSFYFRWVGQQQTSYILAAPAIDPMLSVPILPYPVLMIIIPVDDCMGGGVIKIT